MIDWQTRGEGRLAHCFHALEGAALAALDAPSAPGVHELAVVGEVVFAYAAHAPRLPGRPLCWGPVVYATAADAEQHAEAWIERDRDRYGEG